MISIKHQGKYLTQGSMIDLLKQLVMQLGGTWLGNATNPHNGFVIPNSDGHKWDAAFKIGSDLFAVDYDGNHHYQNNPNKKDDSYDMVAKSMGWKPVRIPYWIQLDEAMMKYYFNVDVVVERDPFLHGFVVTKYDPRCFCPEGLTRFKRELNELPEPVRNEVIETLRAKSYFDPNWIN